MPKTARMARTTIVMASRIVLIQRVNKSRSVAVLQRLAEKRATTELMMIATRSSIVSTPSAKERRRAAVYRMKRQRVTMDSTTIATERLIAMTEIALLRRIVRAKRPAKTVGITRMTIAIC